MNRTFSTFPLIVILLSLFASCADQKDSNIVYAQKEIPSELYEMHYTSGNWDHPDYKNAFESFGNHRIEIEVNDPAAGVVQLHIPWRRKDNNPQKKAILIVDEKSGRILANKRILTINNENGHIIFEPFIGVSNYFLYYLPHLSTGGYYPKLTYIEPDEKPDDQVGSALNNYTDEEIEKLPEARILSAQSIDDFHSFYPMEVIATKNEVDQFVSEYPAPYYLFPEYREHIIKTVDYLPFHWIKRDLLPNGIVDNVKKGEYYTFQIGLWSPINNLSNVNISFSDLKSDAQVIASELQTCFNTEGIDLNGLPFTKTVNINKNKLQALWCGIQIPTTINKGVYSGHVIVKPEGQQADTIYISLHIESDNASEDINSNSQNMNRLRWLNSSIGSDDEFITYPFIPLETQTNSIRILGRSIELDPIGLPSEIQSFFSQEMTHLNATGAPILASPIRFNVINSMGEGLKWNTKGYTISQESSGVATWSVEGLSSNLILKLAGRAEYDGMLDYKITLIAKGDVSLSDINLTIPMEINAARYMLGLGYKGCSRPEKVSWKWDVPNKHQEGAWLGNINKGLQYVLRDENYERPLNTNFYKQKPLNLPVSWDNDGKGGIRISKKRGAVAVENYSGKRKMQKGDTLHFNVRFLITPFKTIDTKTHFNTRFVHKYVPVDSVVAWNGTIVNVHHANEINPYINYPFYNLDQQKAYIDEAHSKGIKVKLYNTIRELTYKAHELFAMKSLEDEILNDGEGGGHGWLQEHLKSNYHAAWHATSVNDASILNKGNSRWTNYYIEGINWLAENQKIDGLYLDDIAFSRTTVKRISNVLNKHRDEVVIDLHSANQFNERDGYNNSAFLYMEHMPYISRLWFGEYFEYDLGPDYWMTEVSGLPFGLTGEMLEGGGHPYRGLVFGMTSRIYGNIDMRPMWELFDDFGIAESEMLGYWVDRSPIKTNSNNIKSTVYLKKDKVLIAIGSWNNKDINVPLLIDWEALNFNKNHVELLSPSIKGVQEHGEFDISKPILIKSQQGLILVLEKLN